MSLFSNTNNKFYSMSDTEGALSGWDPMKTAYEQKMFNSYHESPYNANVTEKHSPVRGYVTSLYCFLFAPKVNISFNRINHPYCIPTTQCNI